MTELLVIDVGDAPDDGTGDTLYEAFTKVNANFSYLYSVEADSTILSNIISLSPPTGNYTEYGLNIQFANASNVSVLYDSTLSWLDPVTELQQDGAFKFTKDNTTLVGIYTNSISTFDNQNLNLLSKGTGVVSVAGTFNYEHQVFEYTLGTIDAAGLLAPSDPDALVNAQLLVDYVNAYYTNNTTYQIVATDNSATRVVATGGTAEHVQVLINNNLIATFTETEVQLGRILVNTEIASPAGEDLVLNPGANLNVSGSRITNVADPVAETDAVNLRTLTNSPLGSIIGTDLTNAPNGSLLIYNAASGMFEVSTTMIDQTMDAGIY